MDILSETLDRTACANPQTLRLAAREPLAGRPSQREAAHREALQELAERHARFVYRVAYAVVRNTAEAEDVVQETFLQLLRGSPERIAAGVIGDELGYLARVAWRFAVRRGRRQRLPPGQSAGQAQELLLDLPAAGPTPEQAAVQGDLEAWLHLRIDELPEKLRQPLALTALGEFSGPQIAALLGIPEGTVRRRIHTARQILRQQMENRKGGRR
jgi:RNA polymerase sigma-70 factor (ECF subfamily)